MKTLFIALLACIFLSEIELEQRSLLDNQIEMLVPKEFTIMAEEDVKIKYPTKNRPRLILTDEPGTTNLAFTLTEAEADSALVVIYHEKILSTYKKNYPTAKWLQEGFMNINGKNVGYFKMITQGLDQKIYNYIFITDVKGKLLVGTFNCVEKDLKTWQGPADSIVASFKVKS